ncbi:MAG: hypothetical protein K2M82_04665 [Lachnospiraceae bacterium]|nr:hypothetical protein [Lachnospiraceae bacterium]
MKAIKDNKVYTIDEASKRAYLSQGYDIIDESGDIIEHSPTATVPYSEYAKVIAENEVLQSQLAAGSGRKK